MAKRKKTGKITRGNTTSVGQVRAERAVDALAPEIFSWWAESTDMPAEYAHMMLKCSQRFVAAYFEKAPSSTATQFELEPFTLTLAEQLAQLIDVDEDEVTVFYEFVHYYIDFLMETGRWTGPSEDLIAIHNTFHEADSNYPSSVEIPELSEAEELTGLAGTELVKRMEALLRWVGEGQAVTNTGVLRLKDIEAAGAAVGVAVRGHASAPTKNLQAAAQNLQIKYVKSMHEEPLLGKLWVALQDADLIRVGSTRVKLTERALQLLAPNDPERLAMLRDFTTEFLMVSVLGEDLGLPWVADAAMAQTAAMVLASADQPIRVDALASAVAAGEKGLDEYAPIVFRERMEVLAELGLVQLDEWVTVPPFMVASVAELSEMANAIHEAGSMPGDNQDDPAQRLLANGAPPYMLQLKIDLQDSDPPIWRRLVVRPDLTLPDLHQIIQVAFDWQDCHLHEFRVGGIQGVSYAPPSDDFGFGEPSLNEAEYTVGELLSQEKDKIDYIYDFGDNWHHEVLVEKILPYDDGVPNVRCIGGGGAGPAEDSGGVWGWQGILAAIADPSHEEHSAYRDWLVLEPGEELDPASFDQEYINEHYDDVY